MKTNAVGFKLPAIILSLTALSMLSAPATTYAATATIGANPATAYVIQGAWYDSGATLAEDVQASLYHTSILISDHTFLRVGWLIKIDSEYMLIQQLINGAVGQPDTMVVSRPANGSAAAYHQSGRSIKARTTKLNIWANQVSDPEGWGLGAFQLSVTLPPDVQYVRLSPQLDWLASTGRSPWCNGPVQAGGSWQVSCFTLGNPEQPGYPLGPSGSGLIASLVVLPSQQVSINTISLNGSFLLNTPGHEIPSTVQNPLLAVLQCPDANIDGRVNSGDVLLVALHLGDRGMDSGATLETDINSSQMAIQISDQSLLTVTDTISIDAEQMSVVDLQEGTPDVMTAARGANYTPTATHQANSHIYRATVDGNMDGTKGYTSPRDVNHDGVVNSGDFLLVALVLGMTCSGS